MKSSVGNGSQIGSRKLKTIFRFGLKAVFIALMLLCAVEMLLQAGAFLVSKRASIALPQVNSGQRVILCIGDSFTYGMGSSNPHATYPSQVEKILRDRSGLNYKVISNAWPGQNSRDVLTGFEQGLITYKPDLVFVLIGINDSWTFPDQLTLGPGQGRTSHETAFRWRFRLPRVLAWFKARNTKPYGSSTPGNQAHQASGAPLSEKPQTTMTYMQAAEYIRLGKHSLVAENIKELEITINSNHERSLENILLLVSLLRASGNEDKCLEVCLSYLKMFPDNPHLLFSKAWAYYQHGRLEDSLRSVEKAIMNRGSMKKSMQASLFMLKGDLLVKQDKSIALENYYQAWLLQREITFLKGKLDNVDYSFDELYTGISALTVSPNDKKALTNVIDNIKQIKENNTVVLTFGSHLEQICSIADYYNVKLCILSYPFYLNPHEMDLMMKEVAVQCGAAYLDLAVEFKGRLEGLNRDDFFVPDGHCNDAGYKIMAEIIADNALQILKK